MMIYPKTLHVVCLHLARLLLHAAAAAAAAEHCVVASHPSLTMQLYCTRLQHPEAPRVLVPKTSRVVV